MTVGYGPLMYVDGPLPVPPRYSLVKAARQVPTTDERWINGTSQWPYSVTNMGLHDPCAAEASSSARTKLKGVPTGRIDTGTIVQWLAESCTTGSVASDQQGYVDRAARMYAARESFLLESELVKATLIPGNPYLADSNCVKLNTSATNAVNGLAELEAAIGASKEAGVIHCSPAMLVSWSAALGGVLKEENGKLLSPNGNVIIPGAGYAGHAPDGKNVPIGTEEWAYASGPVEIRMTPITQLPDTISEALDRKQNLVTYYAERYYNIVWSRLVQAAVLIDRCQVGCAA
jgi:hypothetical protein